MLVRMVSVIEFCLQLIDAKKRQEKFEPSQRGSLSWFTLRKCQEIPHPTSGLFVADQYFNMTRTCLT